MFFFFNDTATTEIYTLSLHDALPIYVVITVGQDNFNAGQGSFRVARRNATNLADIWSRSEEHTSELQSQSNLVCRLLLEKKKKKRSHYDYTIRQLHASKSLMTCRKSL